MLHALSDPLRLHIVFRLATDGGELPCSHFDVPVTKSTSTHHFRVLREAGVIRQVYRGTAKMNGLRRDDLAAAPSALIFWTRSRPNCALEASSLASGFRR